MGDFMRHRMTQDGPVPFTNEEESAWNAMEEEERRSRPIIKAQDMRKERNARLLKDIDSMNVFKWEALNQNQKEAWRQYRQSLLDVPQQAGFPDSINWPNPPVSV